MSCLVGGVAASEGVQERTYRHVDDINPLEV